MSHPAPAIDLTDTPDIPDDERMTAGELKTIREFLGLTTDWLARHMGVNPKTPRDWETGRYPVPDHARQAIEDLEDHTGRCIAAYVEALTDMPDPGVYVYRDDRHLHLAQPGLDMPAAWHRAVIARVALEVPRLRIAFAPAEEG